MATITYKCPNCDGGLQFDPESQQYECEYCNSKFSQKDLDKLDPAHSADQTVTEEGGEAEVSASAAILYTCPSCGAELVTDETTAATFCYYCHNPVVLSGKLEGGFTPDYIIPFSIEREKALELFSQWIAKKKFVPRAFYSPKQMETMSGIYFPYLLYNCQVEGRLEADATRVRVWTAAGIQYTETKRFDVERHGDLPIRNLTRNALKKANRKLVDGVLPYPMDVKKPFHMGYLSGFQAERRDMERQEFEADVEREVKEFAESSLRGSVSGYQTVSVKSHQESISSPDWKYAMLPVWTLTYNDKSKNKIYYFAMNGRTGNVCGELPVDMGRLAILFLTIFFPVFFIMLLGGYLL